MHCAHQSSHTQYEVDWPRFSINQEYRSKLYEIMQHKTIDRTSEKIQMYNSKIMNGSKKRYLVLLQYNNYY